MTLKNERCLGTLAAEREKYVINALRLYTDNTGYDYFHMHVPEAMASGKSAWGHLPYTHKEDDENVRNRHINQAVSDLKNWGVFEIDPQYFYRNHSEFYKLKDDYKHTDIEFGLLASKRTYRVLVEIYKCGGVIKDYKLFGRTVITGVSKDGWQYRSWKCKIRGYFYTEIHDLIKYGLITTTDGSAGYRKYSLTDLGRTFMGENEQFATEDYRF